MEELEPEKRRIDVWWSGDATSRLMLLFAFLVTRSNGWEGAKIKLIATSEGQDPQKKLESLVSTLEEVRIEAEPEIVESFDEDLVAEYSASATLVFLPFRLRGYELLNLFGGSLGALVSKLPAVALVLAAEDIDLDAEPEKGAAGDLAEALDALADAERRATQAEKDASEAAELAEEKRHEIREAAASGAHKEVIEEIRRALLEAKEKASRAARSAAKCLAKAEDAAREVESLGVKPASMKGEDTNDA